MYSTTKSAQRFEERELESSDGNLAYLAEVIGVGGFEVEGVLSLDPVMDFRMLATTPVFFVRSTDWRASFGCTWIKRQEKNR